MGVYQPIKEALDFKQKPKRIKTQSDASVKYCFGVVLMKISTEQKREVLRELGFRRQDRTFGGVHKELWRHKDFPNSLGQPLESCWKHIIRYRFVTIVPEARRIIYWWEEGN